MYNIFNNMAKLYTNVNIKTELLNTVKLAVNAEVSILNGVTSVPQFINTAIREKLERLGIGSINSGIVNDSFVRLIDRRVGEAGKVLTVYYNRGGKPWCDHCEKPDCFHIDYAMELPTVKAIMHGMDKIPKINPYNSQEV